MTVHVFSGPSSCEVPRGVRRHAPVAHGDLYALDAGPGDSVLIVDGVYQHRAPVRHKEILELLARGVAVYGAASLGALRAAELDTHGMRGLGTVYGWYRDGRIDADADVALVHGDAEAGHRAFTVAVVSVLAATDRLVRQGRLDPGSAAAVVAAARSVHFTERSPAALRAAARGRGVAEATELALEALAGPDGDVKRTDASAALAAVLADGPAEGPVVRVSPGSDVPDTSYRREWALEHTPAGPGLPRLGHVLAYARLFLPEYPEVQTARVRAGMRRPEHTAVARTAPRWLTTLTDDDLVARGLLAPHEHGDLSPGARAERLLVRSFRLRSGRLVDHEVPPAIVPRVPELAAQCARALALGDRLARTNPTFHPWDLTPDLVEEAFAELWRVADPATAALDRGFRDREDFIGAARPFFVAARAAVAIARRKETA